MIALKSKVIKNLTFFNVKIVLVQLVIILKKQKSEVICKISLDTK